MFNYRHHIFVCVNQRPPGHPKGDCATKQSRDLLRKFQEETEKRQLWETVAVSGSTCLGACMQGPVVVVYPEGTWYGQVKVQDVEEIMDQHVVGGKPVERLLLATLINAGA
ncbi:MAG TPA: (2Fe-2S) ferredoxin domain-containing protein [Candidatus Baltobacteraceae bacterium]|nr:(2Fe-2S) ferredoxin domain-containing protein [Candidatus Baltobacteraceae bacterium]